MSDGPEKDKEDLRRDSRSPLRYLLPIAFFLGRDIPDRGLDRFVPAEDPLSVHGSKASRSVHVNPTTSIERTVQAYVDVSLARNARWNSCLVCT